MAELYCTDCGAELTAGKPFCASCGAPTGAGPTAAVDDTASHDQVDAPARSRKRVWVVGGIVLLLVVAGVLVGAMVMAQNRAAEQAAAERTARLAALQKAYEGMVVVESATQVGVNYGDYGTRVRDAAAALAVYEPTDSASAEAKDHLTKALALYKNANDAWATKFEEYETLAFADFKEEHSELSAYDADSAVQEYWTKAGNEMDAARTVIEEYENPASE